MFVIPNSSAMDATAYGGGPGTFVAQIATGSPESIEKLVAQRLKQAEQFLALINQARSATQTLQKAWSGQASETAVKKFTDTLNSFEQIVKVIQTSSTLLTTSSTLIKASQTAYTSVVNSVNPTVAALSSNWWTYAAAVSLSTSVSATLRAFINGIEAMLSALGGGQLMQEVTEVIKIISDIEKLIGSGSHGATVPPAGSFTSPTATGATNQLKTLPQVASSTGQQVASSGQDPAAAATLSQYQNQMNSGIGTQFQNPAQTGTQTTGTQTGGTMPTGGGVPYTPPGMTTGNGATIPGQNPTGQQYPQGQYPTGQYPNLNQLLGQQGQNPTTGQYQYPPANQQPVDQNSGWNAVNPPANSDTPVVAQPVSPPVHTAPVAPPAAPPAASATPPGDITVTTTYDGVSTTVTMPVGTQTDVTLVDPTNGSQVHEHIAAGVS